MSYFFFVWREFKTQWTNRKTKLAVLLLLLLLLFIIIFIIIIIIIITSILMQTLICSVWSESAPPMTLV